MAIEIFCDSLTEGIWFCELAPELENARMVIIQGRGNNPDYIEELIKYDRPDIILVHDGKPVLVLEKTREVPTGHNVGQRFARLVRAVEKEVFTIYFFPFDALKHGEYAGMCNLNIRLLDAFSNMQNIHNTPVLAVNWPCDDDGELVDDGTENEVLKKIISGFIQSNFDEYCSEIKVHLQYMDDEYSRRLKIRAQYAQLPPSVIRRDTDDFCEEFNIYEPSLLRRKYTYVYKIGMTPVNCKRQDPYTGTQFIYDYAVCRNGPKVSDKNNNLVLWFPKLTYQEWFFNNPNNPLTKSSNWYLTANVLLFSDGHYINLK